MATVFGPSAKRDYLQSISGVIGKNTVPQIRRRILSGATFAGPRPPYAHAYAEMVSSLNCCLVRPGDDNFSVPHLIVLVRTNDEQRSNQ